MSQAAKQYTLTRAQVAKRLGISTSSVRRLEFARLHPVADERGVWRFDPAEVQALGPRAGLRRSRRRPGGRTLAARARQGRTAARVFTMFAAGCSLPQIVVATKLAPQVVRDLYLQWRTSLEDGNRQDRPSRAVMEP